MEMTSDLSAPSTPRQRMVSISPHDVTLDEKPSLQSDISIEDLECKSADEWKEMTTGMQAKKLVR